MEDKETLVLTSILKMIHLFM